MNKRDVKVSVIMACFNSSRYLDESINSVLKQTLADLELILIDDCSTDNTFQVAKRYQLHDDRVSVLSMFKNSGPAIARNTGIQAAKGKWIGILDSDDVALPARFQEQLRLANSDEGLVMICSNSISIDNNGNVIMHHSYPTAHSSLVRRLAWKGGFPPHSSAMYKRAAVEKLSCFNPRFVPSEDCDLWMRLSEIGRVASIGKELVKIRKHEQGISNWKGGLQIVRMGIAATACHFLRINGWPDPSVSANEDCWRDFLKWISTRISEEGYYEQRKAWIDARAEYLATKNRLSGALRFSGHMLRSGQACTLVMEKYLGTSLPKLLAQEWMQKACAAS